MAENWWGKAGGDSEKLDCREFHKKKIPAGGWGGDKKTKTKTHALQARKGGGGEAILVVSKGSQRDRD